MTEHTYTPEDKTILNLYLCGEDINTIASAVNKEDIDGVQKRLEFLLEEIQKEEVPAQKFIELGVMPNFKITEKGRKYFLGED